MPDITVHFDISGSIEDCASFMGLIGFPVSTSLSEADQAKIAVEEVAKAERLKASRQALESLEGKANP